jgi:hypothetical protein
MVIVRNSVWTAVNANAIRFLIDCSNSRCPQVCEYVQRQDFIVANQTIGLIWSTAIRM